MEKGKKIYMKNTVYSIILIIISLLSIFVLAPIASSTEFHEKSIKNLDDKKMTVVGITASMTAVATGLALAPGDATTPLANQIMKISSYMLIIVATIFLEKILLTLTGYLAFKFLIPISCILLIAHLFLRKNILLKLSLKISSLGLILFILVPVSISLSSFIENNYKDQIDNVKNAETIMEEDIDNNDSNDSKWFSTIKEGITSIGDETSKLMEKGKQLLSNFIDTIAILMITTCVIPIIVLMLMVWIVKGFIGIDIPISNIKNKQIKLEGTTDNLVDSQKQNR